MEIVDAQVHSLDAKVELYHNDAVDKYDSLSAELGRDFTWLGIVVALFSLVVGVVVPLILNGEYTIRDRWKIIKRFLLNAWKKKILSLNSLNQTTPFLKRDIQSAR